MKFSAKNQDVTDEESVDVNKPAKKEEPVWITGQLLRVRNGLSLVEWTDAENRLRRGWLSESMIDPEPLPGGGIRVDRPERGIPYGDALETMVEFKADPALFADALHKRGIWTYADVAGRVSDVQVALQTAYGVDTNAVFQAARAHTKSVNQEN